MVSSTWRLEQKHLNQLKDSLATAGLEIYSCTPDLSGKFTGDRVDEIFTWLIQNKH